MKTRPDKPNDDKHEELRQQLWELAYGLLEPHEESALIARVKSDPALARLYAEVKLQTDLVSSAARVEDTSLTISAAGEGVGSAASVNKEKRSPSKTSSRAVPAAKATGGAWGTNWLAVAGTTALLLLLGYGLWQPEAVTNSVAQGEFYYTRVTGLAAMTEGITQKVGVEYQDIHNHGQATELDVRLVDQQGQETYRKRVKTGDNGQAEVDLPGTVLKQGVRLEVAPAADRRAGRSAEVVSTELQVVPEERKTVLLTERPYAEPGESNRFQMFGIGKYSKGITPPATDELMVEKQSGGDVVQPMWTVDRSSGVINGEYQLPKTYSANDGLALRRSAADAKATERQLKRDEGQARESVQLQRGLNAAAKAGSDRAPRAKSGNAERELKPGEGEGGAAFGGGQPGLARSTGPAGAAAFPPAPLAPPAPPPAQAPAAGISPTNAAPAALPDEHGNRKNAAMTAPGSAAPRPSDKPQADAAPMKPGAAPALNAPAPVAPAAPGESQSKEAQQKDQQIAKQEKSAAPAQQPMERLRQEVENLGGLAKAKKPVDGRQLAESLQRQEYEVEVPAQVRGEDLVLVARSGDKTVLRRELTAYKEAEAKVDLPPEVNGLVDVELFRKDQPSAPVLRQQLVRTSARSLNVEVSGLKDSYVPGEKVQLSVRVVDELGRPATGSASVRVWNEVAASAASYPLLLVDSLSQNDLAFSVDSRAEKFPAAAEQDRAELMERKAISETEKVGKELGASSAAGDVFFVDNRSVIEQQYDRAVAIQEMQRTERMQSIGRVLMWSGAALMLLVGVLLISRRPLKSVVWVPAVGLAALCLGLGVAWFLPRQQPGWQLAKALPDETRQVAGEEASGNSPLKPATDDAKSAPAKEFPLPSDAPTLPIAPEAPVAEEQPATQGLKQLAQNGSVPNPSAAAPVTPTPESLPARGGYGGGQAQGGAAPAFGIQPPGATYGANAERKMNLEEQAKAQPRTGVDAAGGQLAAKKSDGNADRRARAASELRDQPADSAAPDSLFWRPLSPIETDGTFTIEFTMPAAESDYRLLIDAIGSGRIGGKEQILHCREE